MDNAYDKDSISYLTLGQESSAEFSDRGSRFIGYAFPVLSEEAFKERLRALKGAHPKAVHHCFAYRIGLDGNRFWASDDGEPSGAAGRPILGQIDSRRLVNTAVVVVRYFGGTLLGVPGLINAYKTAAAFALQVGPSVERPIEDEYEVEFDYTLMNDVMTVVKRHACTVLYQEMQLFCLLRIGIPRRSRIETLSQLETIRGVGCRPAGKGV
jgi:uncharacterized YigZ family protein